MTTPDDAPTAPVDLAQEPAPAAPEPLQPPAATPAAGPAAPPPPPAGTPGFDPAPAGAFAGSSAADAGWGTASQGTATAGPAASTRPDAGESSNQPALVLGVILVVVGGLLLVTRVTDIAFGAEAWPLWIIVPGAAMLIGSLAIPPRGGLGLAIPGAILVMVGLVLWVQATFDAYVSWTYAWALVAPTGPGLAMLFYGAAKGDRELTHDGLRLTLVGLALFAGFAFFFEAVLGISGSPLANADEILPWAAIGFGVLLVVLSMLGGGRSRRSARREERQARRAR